jgi:hypothetical protein
LLSGRISIFLLIVFGCGDKRSPLLPLFSGSCWPDRPCCVKWRATARTRKKNEGKTPTNKLIIGSGGLRDQSKYLHASWLQSALFFLCVGVLNSVGRILAL